MGCFLKVRLSGRVEENFRYGSFKYTEYGNKQLENRFNDMGVVYDMPCMNNFDVIIMSTIDDGKVIGDQWGYFITV